MSVTQKQLASHLGVTPITISRALNDHPAVALKTRRRIRDAARELGYGGPTTWGAQALAARRYNRRMPTGVVAVLVTIEHTLPYFEELLDGLKRECLNRDLAILIAPHHEDALPKLVEQGRVDGLFLIMPLLGIRKMVESLDVPVIKLGFRDNVASEFAILPENHRGAYLATKHLLDYGHREIAHLTYRYAGLEAIDRRSGHCAALAEAGLPLRDELMCDSVVHTRDYQIEQILGELLEAAPNVTAINCYNDWIAQLAIEALAKRGLRVPEDISITGFDDLSGAWRFSPAITSVRYDRSTMGAMAVQLLSRLPDQTDERIIDVLPVSLEVRETTQRLPAQQQS